MDISPEQIWFDEYGMPFLGDFDPVWVPGGSSSPTTTTISLPRRHGKSSFMSPEMVLLSSGSLNPFSTDIFSLGATLFCARCGLNYLEQVDAYDVATMVARPSFRTLVGSSSGSWWLVEKAARDHRINVSEEYKDLVRGMMHADPEQRLTLEQVKAHPWMGLSGSSSSTLTTTLSTSPHVSHYHDPHDEIKYVSTTSIGPRSSPTIPPSHITWREKTQGYHPQRIPA